MLLLVFLRAYKLRFFISDIYLQYFVTGNVSMNVEPWYALNSSESGDYPMAWQGFAARSLCGIDKFPLMPMTNLLVLSH